MNPKAYVYIIGGNANANYVVHEEYSYVIGGLFITIHAHLLVDKRQCLDVRIEARVETDEVIIDWISVQPSGGHTDLVVAVIEELAARYRTACVPNDFLNGDGKQYWKAYLARPKDVPPLAYIRPL